MALGNNDFLFGAVVGSGLMAKAADKAGADFLLALNAGRFRLQGTSSLTSFLPVQPANEWVIEFSEREILGKCKAPIYAGFAVSDPTLDIDHLLNRAKGLGFSGICNFPSTTSIDGNLGALLEREGLGIDREIQLVQKASKLGLGSFVYVQNNTQARQMADAGAKAICVNMGFTGGATGVSTPLTLESAAALVNQVLEGVPKDIDRLCHGGPITSPEQALALTRICSVQGFVAGSTLDRIPLESALDEVTKSFTAIPSLRSPQEDDKDGINTIIGSSNAMQSIRDQLDELVQEDIPVLICGETGTGKSFIANKLHKTIISGDRKPVIVDCAALDAQDGGAYLLGRTAGARQGMASIRGALEQASGSSLIFEEVSALKPDHQGKILKFVDERSIQRIGDFQEVNVQTRIISTTAQDCFQLADEDKFRLDLYYRLSGHEIFIPPLRERIDDIPELVIQIGQRICKGEKPTFSNSALRAFLEHSWPGNIRELKYAIGRAFRSAGGTKVGLKSVEFLRAMSKVDVKEPMQKEPQVVLETERDWIADALARNGFRRAQTASELGMTTRTLYNKIKKYRLQG